jgi:glutamate synthase domain-containing protein 3
MGTGMHGGQIFIRSNRLPVNLPKQVAVGMANDSDLNMISEYLIEFSDVFNINIDEIQRKTFYKLSPNAKNPYKQLYTLN